MTLFTARAYLPGLFERKAFLIVGLTLPLLDFATDCINAGSVLLKKYLQPLISNYKIVPVTYCEKG